MDAAVAEPVARRAHRIVSLFRARLDQTSVSKSTTPDPPPHRYVREARGSVGGHEHRRLNAKSTSQLEDVAVRQIALPALDLTGQDIQEQERLRFLGGNGAVCSSGCAAIYFVERDFQGNAEPAYKSRKSAIQPRTATSVASSARPARSSIRSREIVLTCSDIAHER